MSIRRFAALLISTTILMSCQTAATTTSSTMTPPAVEASRIPQDGALLWRCADLEVARAGDFTFRFGGVLTPFDQLELGRAEVVTARDYLDPLARASCDQEASWPAPPADPVAHTPEAPIPPLAGIPMFLLPSDMILPGAPPP